MPINKEEFEAKKLHSKVEGMHAQRLEFIKVKESAETVTIMGLGCSGVLKIPVNENPRRRRR